MTAKLRVTSMGSFMTTRAEVRQLSADAERAAVREQQQRAKLASKGQQAAATGKKIALVSLAGLVGVALVERVAGGRKSRPAHAASAGDTEPRPRRGLLMRAGMLAVALMRWSSLFSHAWRLLTTGHARMVRAPADAEAAADA